MINRGTLTATLRWSLLVPAVLATLYLCVAAAVGIYIIAARFCPEDFMVSGACYASYMHQLKEGLLIVMPAVAASSMIWAAVRMAPAYKTAAALVTLVVGSLFAIYQTLDTGYWFSLLLTELAAITTALVLIKRHRR